jgi:Leucine Rich Repeat (LRR) protein
MVTCRDTVAPMTWRSQGSISWQHGCWRAIGVALVSGNAGVSPHQTSESTYEEREMLVQAVPKFRRRWLRTTTRGLIVLALIIGAGLGWLVRGAQTQRDAVAAIKNAGGSIAYDWQTRNARYTPGAQPLAPGWIVKLIGIDYFCHVTDVGLFSNPDAAMEHVGKLVQLERLNVRGRSLSDTGMANLTGLTRLSRLDLSNNHITDNGVAYLNGLTALSTLDLSGTQVSDAGLEHLRGLTRLFVVDLRNTRISDAGLVHLKGLSNLAVLHLASTRVTSNGLVQLSGLTALSYLNLRGTQVSDAGLVHLTGMSKLVELNVDGTEVTKSGMKLLQETLPSLKIYHPHPSGPRHKNSGAR